MFQHRSKREQYAVYALSGLFLLVAGYVGAGRLRQPEPMSIQTVASLDPAKAADVGTNKPAEAEPTEVVVDVSGAVKRPGVLRFPVGTRVDEAVKGAGGPTADADLEAINLAAKLQDATVVYVPHKSASKHESVAAGRAEKARMAPMYRGGADIKPVYSPDETTYISVEPVKPPPPSEPRLGGEGGSSSASSAGQPGGESTAPTHRGPKQPTASVSLNNGTEAELETLPGIGPATAQKIIDYRNAHGPFTTIDELLDVKGIGPKKLEKLRPWLKL